MKAILHIINDREPANSETLFSLIIDAILCASLLIEVKIEIPTTKVAVHNFQVGETITIYYPSQYVIVFSHIPQSELEAALRVN